MLSLKLIVVIIVNLLNEFIYFKSNFNILSKKWWIELEFRFLASF